MLQTSVLCRAELVETKKAEAKAKAAVAAAAASTTPQTPTASDSSAATTAPATPATPAATDAAAATASSSSGNSSDADDSSSASSDTDAAASATDSTDDAIQLTNEEIEAFQSGEQAALEALRLNVNVFMPYPACVDSAQAAADEAAVREAAVYLWETVLPGVMRDVKRGAFCPKDGVHLTELLHAHGVNMRYLGQLATIAAQEVPVLSDVCAYVRMCAAVVCAVVVWHGAAIVHAHVACLTQCAMPIVLHCAATC